MHMHICIQVCDLKIVFILPSQYIFCCYNKIFEARKLTRNTFYSLTVLDAVSYDIRYLIEAFLLHLGTPDG